MSPARRPWASLSAAEQMDAVRPLLADGLAPSTIAFQVGAKQSQVARIATKIRQQEAQEIGHELAHDEGHEAAEEAQGSEAPSAADSSVLATDEPAIVAADPVQPSPKQGESGKEEPASVPPEPEWEDQTAAVVSAQPAPAPDILTVISRPAWAVLDRPTRDQIVMRLCADGLSANQIRAHFTDRPSRSAILGVIHRLKTKGVEVVRPVRHTPLKISAPAASKPVESKPPKQNLHPGNIARKANARQFDPGPPLLRAALAFDPLPGVVPVPFGSAGCKWPVDGAEGRGALACGYVRDTSERADEPYCIHHSRIAYTAPSYRPSASKRANERIPA